MASIFCTGFVFGVLSGICIPFIIQGLYIIYKDKKDSSL